MAKQVSKSSLFEKYGDKFQDACTIHQFDEVEFSQYGNLPPGIDSGIAQLVNCGFKEIGEGKQNAGEFMFFADGVVKEPKEFTDSKGNVHRIEGLRTRIMEPIFDTPDRTRKEMADHVGWVQNQLKMLGVDPEMLDADNIEAACEMIEQARPHFRFRTWSGDKEEVKEQAGRWYVVKGGKNIAGPYRSEDELKKKHPYAGRDPMVNHVWNGMCDYVEEEASSVQDETGPAVEGNGEEVAAKAQSTSPATRSTPVPSSSSPATPVNRMEKASTKTQPVKTSASSTPSAPGAASRSPATPADNAPTPSPKAPPKTTTGKPPASSQPAVKAQSAPASTKIPPKPTHAPSPAPTKKVAAPTPPHGPEFDEIDSLVSMANEGDEDARAQLKEMAINAGVSEEEVDNASTWDDVAAMITEAGKETDQEANQPVEEEAEPTKAEPEEQEEGWSPRVEEVYGFRPVDPKSKKQYKDSVECEVTAVDEKARTCSLRSLDDPKKKWDKISWDALEGA